MRQIPFVLLVFGFLPFQVGGCKKKTPPPAPPPSARKVVPPSPRTPPAPAPAKRGYARLDRETFNRVAVRLNLPAYWRLDADRDGAVDPGEVVTLLFYPTRPRWTRKGRFTPAFVQAYERMVRAAAAPPGGATAAERERRRLVRADLDRGFPTLVYHDFRGLRAWEKRFLRAMMRAAGAIEKIYARVTGVTALRPRVPAGDPVSHSLLRRNWSHRCKSPRLEKNEKCSAIPGTPRQIFDLYPADLQKDPRFCRTLEKRPDAKRLMSPFVVVRRRAGKLVAVPYSKAYPRLMGAVARSLRAAAATVSDPGERPLRAYLLAAAQAFTDDDWPRADEAWAKMSARNSRWYLRVAPDETYWEPCSRKAGFHLSLARIDRESLKWQDKLVPLRQEMEDRLAKLVGAPYRARRVAFKLPDFIEIVINAADDRDPFGATIGQSLPNWGKVAQESRGRTVAMSNLFRDPDSLRHRRAQMASLFSGATEAVYSDDPTPRLLATILHEAAHNLGPSHEYRVGGKTDSEAFGGSLASMLEELKAEAAALWYVDLLRRKGVISSATARKVYVEAVAWAFGHISRGMYTDKGKRKAYSQVAAIQVGALLDGGALTFDRKALAANGKDRGAFTLHLEKVPAVAGKQMRRVGGIKGRADKAEALRLAARYVDGKVVPMSLITERVLRYPRGSLVYAFDR